MGEVECGGFNFEVSLSRGNLIIKPRFKAFQGEVAVSLARVKVVELLTKSVIPPTILASASLAASLLIWSPAVLEALESFLGKGLALEAALLGPPLAAVYGFLTILIRLMFGTLNIELDDGRRIEVKFVRRKSAEKLISAIL